MKHTQEQRGLRDPIWQAIGVIIGVLSIIISIFLAYDVYRRSLQFSDLEIVKGVFYNPIYFAERSEGRIAMLIDGEKVNSVNMFSFSISNTGRNPILPDDFIEPIKVSIQEPWQLLAVEKFTSRPYELELQWTKVATNTFQMEPALLNPGDEINVLVFVKNPTATLDEQVITDDEPELTWTARIVDVPLLKVREQQTPRELSGLGSFYLEIYLSGWEIYWSAGIAIFLSFIGLILGSRFNRTTHLSSRDLFLIICITVLAFSSAEILVYIIDGRIISGIGLLLIAMHVVLLIYIVWPALVRQALLASKGIRNSSREIKQDNTLTEHLLEKSSEET